MPFLFDTDAISELLRPRPRSDYLQWLATIPREEQFTSAVVVGELYRGAFRSQSRDRHLKHIDERVLQGVTTLPYDAAIARVYGRVSAQLEQDGQRLADADVQIAATALFHGLELVTGNLRHFARVRGLAINRILANARLD